jgi:hypothetical protein
MSLIQDALKRKTEEQNPLPKAPPPKHPGPSKPAKEPAPPAAPVTGVGIPPPNSSEKKLFIILSAAIVLILLVIGNSIYFYLNTAKTPALVEISEEPAAPAPIDRVKPVVPVAAPAPKPAPKPKNKWPDLSFSGSAVGGNQILAIINGRMLSVGDSIKGAKVLQIGKNEVLVEFKGEKRVLGVDDE